MDALENEEIIIKDAKIRVDKGVFNPHEKATNSTSIIFNNLPNLNGQEILDIGCGTGIIAIICALNGAKKVLAVDIDEKAIKNTEYNIKANNVEDKVKVIKSYLFENVQGMFDCIFANLPISDKNWNLSTSTLDLAKQFIAKSKNHLNKNGKIYFAWASFSKISPLKKFIKEQGYNLKEIKEKKLKKIWYLFEITF